MRIPAEVELYAEDVARRLRAVVRDALLGVYVHGSAVLGDFDRRRSDVDLVAVVTRALTPVEKERVAEALSQRSLPSPATGLELHVVRADAIVASPAPAFELHLATADDRVVDGAGHPGDADLVLHFAVLAAHGHAVVGPPARQVFPQIPQPLLLDALRAELRWASEHASPTYQILTVCRARRFLDEGVLCSKTAAGEWARDRVADPAPVDAALGQRRGATKEPPDAEQARRFLAEGLERLETRAGAARVSRP